MAQAARGGMPSIRIPRPTWLAVLVLLGAGSLAYPLLPPLPFDATYLAVGALAVAATFLGVVAHRPVHRLPWLLVAAGLTLIVVGDVTFAMVSEAVGGTPPFPDASDVPYLLGQAVLVAGGFGLARTHLTADCQGLRRSSLRLPLIDAGIVATSACLLLWLAVGAAIVATPGATATEVAVGLAYPLLDVTMLGALTAMLLSARTRTPSHLLLISAFTVQLFTDVVYAIQETSGTYVTGEALDSGWLLTYALLAAAVLHPSIGDGCRPSGASARQELSRRHLLVLSMPILSAWLGILVAGHVLVPSDPDLFLLKLTGATPFGFVVAGLLLWRIASASADLADAARERDEANRRELAIADATALFALADGEADVRAAVIDTTALLHHPATVALWLPGDPDTDAEADEIRVMLSDDPAEGWLSVRCGARPDEATLAAFERVASAVHLAIDRCRLAEKLRNSERRFRALVRHAPDAITVHDEHGELTYASPTLGRIVGVPADRLIGTRWRELLHPEDLPRVAAVHAEVRTSPPGTTVLVETRLRRRDGGWRWVESRMTNLLEDPTVRGVVANHRDTTERQRLQRQLQHQATHDALTGLANRRDFSDAVRDVLGRGSNAVIFLDLDRFKDVNDRLGHTVGDRLLQATAERIRTVIRPGDLPARLGGDEFAVLLRRASPTVAEGVAQRMLDAISQPLTVDGIELVATASLGVAVAEGDDEWIHDLLHDADQAMYSAKRAGRGRIVRYSAATRQQAADRLELESELRAALEHGGLSLAYEPVVDLEADRVVGANTVVCWEHPEHGGIPPETFLPIAARIGVLGTIADWAIREACWQASAWTELAPHFRTAVDLPSAALHDGSFAEETESVLLAARVPDGGLVLAVEAELLADHVPHVPQTLQRLQDRAIRLRLAGFGASGAPLDLLRRASVDELEIPAIFVAGLGQGPEDAAIARAVIQLGRSLGLDTVARGVASDVQRRQLMRRRCRYAAGPVFGYPQPAEQITARLRGMALEQQPAR